MDRHRGGISHRSLDAALTVDVVSWLGLLVTFFGVGFALGTLASLIKGGTDK
jgi:hypothetical protein